MTQTFSVPLYLRVGVRRKKNVWLNLNAYRNWYHHQNHEYKIRFKQAIQESRQELKPMEGIVDIKIDIYYPNKIRRDLDNSLAVITKFTLDSLVEAGILPDDSVEYVRSINGNFCGYNRDDPKAVITLSNKDT